jgi:hypothetical protein
VIAVQGKNIAVDAVTVDITGLTTMAVREL